MNRLNDEMLANVSGGNVLEDIGGVFESLATGVYEYVIEPVVDFFADTATGFTDTVLDAIGFNRQKVIPDGLNYDPLHISLETQRLAD